MWIQDHGGKAGLLWSAYKNRMGTTSEPAMVFDLQNLIPQGQDLDDIVLPITHEEVDLIVRKMPKDKAL